MDATGIAARSATSAQNGVSSTLRIPIPQTTVPGDVLLAVVSVVHGPEITPPPGWSPVRTDLIPSGNNLEQAIYVHVAAAGDAASSTWSFASPHGAVGGIVDYRGVDTAEPVVTSAAAVTTNTLTIRIPSVSAAGGGQTLVAALGVQGNRSPTLPAALTTRAGSALGTVAGEKVTFAAADQELPTGAPTGTLTARVSLPSTGVGQAVVLRPAPAFDRFDVGAATRPQGITTGPRDDIWFTAHTSVGRVTPGGEVSLFPVPTVGGLGGITTGPDGNVWFAEGGNYLDRITPEGRLSRFPLPRPAGGVTVGSDGRLWLAESKASLIGRYDIATRTLVEYPTPTRGAWPHGLHLGPDGNVWFAETYASKVAKITPAGTITEYPLPTPSASPRVIVAGPDGNLWFTEYAANRIGRITTSGRITEFPLPTADAHPNGIAASGGSLWFTEYDGNRIGRITTGGTISEYPVPTPEAGPNKIVAAPGGHLWFTEQKAGAVTRLRVP